MAKFIQKRGEGIHHICFGVENVEAALRHFEALGIELLDQKPRKMENGISLHLLTRRAPTAS